MGLFLYTLPARGWMFSTAYLGTEDGEGFLGSLSACWDAVGRPAARLMGVPIAVRLWSVLRKIKTGRGNFLLVGWKLVLG